MLPHLCYCTFATQSPVLWRQIASLLFAARGTIASHVAASLCSGSMCTNISCISFLQQVAERTLKVDDLFLDLQDGVVLYNLLEVLSKQSLAVLGKIKPVRAHTFLYCSCFLYTVVLSTVQAFYKPLQSNMLLSVQRVSLSVRANTVVAAVQVLHQRVASAHNNKLTC
jgi:hypothetical protein